MKSYQRQNCNEGASNFHSSLLKKKEKKSCYSKIGFSSMSFVSNCMVVLWYEELWKLSILFYCDHFKDLDQGQYLTLLYGQFKL